MTFLAEQGVACESYDQRGHGKSEGRRGYVRAWGEFLDDLSCFLDARLDGDDRNLPTFILGHSHGGLIVAAAAERGLLDRPNLAGCILSSPYFLSNQAIPAYKIWLAHAVNPIIPWLQVNKGFRDNWLTRDPAMLAEDRADMLMNKNGTPRWYLSTLAAQAKAMAEASRFKLPALIMVSDADVIADPATTKQFYSLNSSSDKSLYVYQDRTHELFRDIGREQVFADVFGWIKARTERPGSVG